MAMDHEPGRLLENLIRSSVDGVFAFDRDCRVVLWSAAMERISGVGASDAVGRDVVDLFPFLAEAGEDACLQAALRGETAVAADRLYTDHETGHRAYFEAQYSPLYDDAGEVAGGIGLLRDITHRKRSEANATGLLREQIARHEAERLSAALRHSEERYRAFFAHSAEGIWLAELDEPLDVTLPPDAQVDHFFRCSYLAECNDAMARMYGYTRAD